MKPMVCSTRPRYESNTRLKSCCSAGIHSRSGNRQVWYFGVTCQYLALLGLLPFAQDLGIADICRVAQNPLIFLRGRWLIAGNGTALHLLPSGAHRQSNPRSCCRVECRGAGTTRWRCPLKMWSPLDILIRTFCTWVGTGAGQCRNPSEYLRRLETKANNSRVSPLQGRARQRRLTVSTIPVTQNGKSSAWLCGFSLSAQSTSLILSASTAAIGTTRR